MPILRGVVMELNDCSLPLLKGLYCCYTNSDEYQLSTRQNGGDAFQLGSKAGMVRVWVAGKTV